MLRRPPTRIQLKTDDIEEYDEILRERKMEMGDESMVSNFNKSNFTNEKSSRSSNSKRKKSNAERIGIHKGRR
eukprot:CAMPEP_0203647920 /NCGR_PEP_ID=MMETSP0088-20131115/17196_1 /ASSEMBLY_ACC=CAM_ASM_001087 /TAXON_ID=426623 /ORGANISM="Chaetoceros affinis, Strain CCMP159" /LENGTH=72 /DNA_ID=CAMNT_0050505751 /DNA_START=26 /DNA_END=244 /DNA_ORIENTATION=+